MRAFLILIFLTLSPLPLKAEEITVFQYLYKDNWKIGKELCSALGQTPRFDSGTRRQIMADYLIPRQSMVTIEENIEMTSGVICHISMGMLFYDGSPLDGEVKKTDAGASLDQVAEKLINLLNPQEEYDQELSEIVNIQIQQTPQLAPHKTVISEFFAEFMGYEIIMPHLIKVYTDELTLSELHELHAFYSSDVGKKYLKLIPKFEDKAIILAKTLLEENVGAFQEIIEADMKRIQKLQSE